MTGRSEEGFLGLRHGTVRRTKVGGDRGLKPRSESRGMLQEGYVGELKADTGLSQVWLGARGRGMKSVEQNPGGPFLSSQAAGWVLTLGYTL